MWLRYTALTLLVVIAGDAVNPSCECLIYSSTYGKEYGRFTSPDFPKPYPPNIDCLLYTFIAGSQEIIELAFIDFNIYKANKDCSQGDYVRVYLNLDRPEVNEESAWAGLLCGTLPTVPPFLYSGGSVLTLELHSGVEANNSTGFQGTFRFIDTSKYRSDGIKIPDAMCEYQFPTNNHTVTRGRFYSPFFPSSYTKNSKCVYRFKARQRERIRILFEEITFQKGDVSCLDREDVLKIHDGPSFLSPVMAVLCNEMSNVELLSTSNQIYIEFSSSSEWPGHGFMATYYYQPVTESSTNIIDHSTKLSDIGPAVSATRSSCDVKIVSDSSKTGQILSPGFPVSYPPKSRCRYEFQGSGKERIKITFTHFNLYATNRKKKKSCDREDSVVPYIVTEGRLEKLDAFCGSSIPKRIMSNGPRLMLEFTSSNSSKGSGGFRAEYSFVKDFGVTTGKQLAEYPCAFRYTGDETPYGHFHSPNFPGLYPRDTECHYFFHGTRTQKLKIYFTYFDIEGIHPCDSVTASDYVEFSNFMEHDKMFTRHCGQLESFEIEFERRFFRVTFRSNDRLDGTGFNATYHFINHPIARKTLPASSSSSSGKIYCSISLWIFLISIPLSME